MLGGQLVPAFYQYLPLFNTSKHARQEGGPPVDQHLLSRTPGPKNTLHHGHLCLWASKNWSDHLIALSGAQAKRNSSSGPGKPEPQRKESFVQWRFGNSGGQALPHPWWPCWQSFVASRVHKRKTPTLQSKRNNTGRLPYLKLRMSAPARWQAQQKSILHHKTDSTLRLKNSEKPFLVALGVVWRSVRTLKG